MPPFSSLSYDRRRLLLSLFVTLLLLLIALPPLWLVFRAQDREWPAIRSVWPTTAPDMVSTPPTAFNMQRQDILTDVFNTIQYDIGYGHATRVSAFARHLLSLPLDRRPTVYIVSSAPEHVFADSIACGARYRFAEIDPVIVQPLAYRVDRQKSVEVLQQFLDKKDALLERERQWLVQIGAHCVLSDAAFLGCLAARYASLPSILITNFSFDSVYSYLSTPLLDTPPTSSITPSLPPPTPSLTPSPDTLPPDAPIPPTTLTPLLLPLTQGYRSADLLIRLPGHIPMPSFFKDPPLPASEWVDVGTRRLTREVEGFLDLPLPVPSASRAGGEGGGGVEILPRIDIEYPGSPHPNCITNTPESPSPSPSRQSPSRQSPSTRPARPRQAWQSPLIVRPPSTPFIYTPAGRSKLLQSIGVPEHVARDEQTKVLVVSFGGQVVRRPVGGGNNSRAGSRAGSRASSRRGSEEDVRGAGGKLHGHANGHANANGRGHTNGHTHGKTNEHGHTATLHAPRAAASLSLPTTLDIPTTLNLDLALASANANADTDIPLLAQARVPERLTTPNHIYIPGAPPVTKTGVLQRTVSERRAQPVQPAGLDTQALQQEEQEQVQQMNSSPSIRMVPPTPNATEFGNGNGDAVRGGFFVGADANSSSEDGDDDCSSGGYDDDEYSDEEDEEDMDTLLPDSSWIAVVCGVNKASWKGSGSNDNTNTNANNTANANTNNTNNTNASTPPADTDDDDGLPEGFYVAPRDVYMPDLTAVGDVLLGKLGYGTVSECVDACTPFVYVSRPLFIEEHGLRRLLEAEGVGVELTREAYEGGRWAKGIREAWEGGIRMKEAKRKAMGAAVAAAVEGEGGAVVDVRQEEGRKLAGEVVGWVEDWWR